jgi:hypothetical protein
MTKEWKIKELTKQLYYRLCRSFFVRFFCSAVWVTKAQEMQRIYRTCFSKLSKNLITAVNLLGYLSSCFSKVGNYCLLWCDVMKYDKQLPSSRKKVFFPFQCRRGGGIFVRKSDDWLQHCKLSHRKRKSLLTRSLVVCLWFLLMQSYDFKFSV